MRDNGRKREEVMNVGPTTDLGLYVEEGTVLEMRRKGA